MQRVVLHIDMDAFFASVEQRDNPDWRGKPVIVGALPGNRGVVSAASYEARAFGVHSAMPVSEAFQRCPQGIFVRPSMDHYSRDSEKIMEILQEFSPEIEQISVDEAFLDITGTERLWGAPVQTARSIKTAIRDRLGLTASVGIAPNKFLAKIASDLDKPDGITEVPFDPQRIVSWLAPLSVGKMWGVGKKSAAVFLSQGVRTIGDLQKRSLMQLQALFGANGAGWYDLCRGIDNRPISEAESAKSVSRENTFEHDTADRAQIRSTLLSLAQDVGHRARQAGLKGRTVILTWRGSDFARHSKRVTLTSPTNTAHEIFNQALTLLARLPPRLTVRLIGVGVTNFDTVQQTSLFDDDPGKKAWERSERAVDKVTDKFGRGAVWRGGAI